MEHQNYQEMDRAQYLEEFFNGSIHLSELECRTLKANLWRLQGEWMYLWHRTRERGLISEKLSLAHRIQALGREEGLKVLVYYGQLLEETTMAFDVEGIDEILSKFPLMVRILGEAAD